MPTKPKKCDECGKLDPRFIVVEENPAKIICADCLTEWVKANMRTKKDTTQ